MGIDVQWLDEANIVLNYGLRDPWTVDDLYTAIRIGYDMSHAQPEIYIIYDFTQSRGLPPTFFYAVDYMRKMKQSNARARMVIAAPQFVKSIYHIFQRLAADLTTGIHFVDTQAEALDYIDAQHSPPDNPA